MALEDNVPTSFTLHRGMARGVGLTAAMKRDRKGWRWTGKALKAREAFGRWGDLPSG